MQRPHRLDRARKIKLDIAQLEVDAGPAHVERTHPQDGPLVARPERHPLPRDRRAEDVLRAIKVAGDIRQVRRKRIDTGAPGTVSRFVDELHAAFGTAIERGDIVALIDLAARCLRGIAFDEEAVGGPAQPAHRHVEGIARIMRGIFSRCVRGRQFRRDHRLQRRHARLMRRGLRARFAAKPAAADRAEKRRTGCNPQWNSHGDPSSNGQARPHRISSRGAARCQRRPHPADRARCRACHRRPCRYARRAGRP